MLAKNIMTTSVVTVSPEATVSEIARTLVDNRIGAVPVVEPDGHIVGIVSEGDLMRRSETETERHRGWWLEIFNSSAERAAEYIKAHGKRARDVMSRPAITVTEDATAGEIAELLEERKIKRVPVTRDGHLVGVVSRANLVQALATYKSATEKVVTAEDRDIRARFQKVLDHEFSGRTSFLDFTVSGGTVTIWGAAESAAEKQAIRVAAESVPGAKAVIDHMRLLSPMVRALVWAE